jgi:LysR family hydrogen peroxide-inducible transcriptional activator
MLPSAVSLTQLRYIVALDHHGNFGRAADACHVTQPTLSMQLHKLEETLGVTLFDRSRMPVVATDVGRLIVDQARVVLREAEWIADLRDMADGVVAGELRLGVIPTLAPYLLPRALRDLKARHPALELVVEELVTEQVVAALRLDRLDAGLIATVPDAADIVSTPLFHEPFVGYVSEGHRLSARRTISTDDLSADDCWVLAEGHCLRTQVSTLCGRAARGGRSADACTRNARFESGNLETLKRLVEQGDGMTLLPALAAADLSPELARRHLRPFTAPGPSRDVLLVTRRAHLKRHLIDAVVEAVRRSLPTGGAKGTKVRVY